MKRFLAVAALAALTAGPAAAVSGGGFSLSIQGASEDYQGYVRMRHGQHYSVCFSNQTGDRADAEVTIDGLDMGTWRLNPYQSACVERPANDTGRFTFYRADSADGRAVGSDYVTSHDKGRVRVNFYPEQRYAPPPPPVPVPYNAPQAQRSYQGGGYAADSAPAPQAFAQEAAPTARRSQGLGSGVTGLEGESGQRFGSTGSLDRDYNRMVTLELRLIHDPALDYQRPGPRPLPGRYNQYAPPPIDY